MALTVTVLPCGRDPIAAADHIRAGHSNPHEQSCPYCQAAAEEAGIAARAADQLAHAHVEVPPTLLPNVMRTVWAELRPTDFITLPTLGGGVQISTLAVAAALRHSLDALAELTIHSCTVDINKPLLEGNGTNAAPTLGVHLTATTIYPDALAPIAAACRHRVTNTLHGQFTLQPGRIDIDFIDLDPPEKAAT